MDNPRQDRHILLNQCQSWRLNNEIFELYNQEKNEIIRILKSDLSPILGNHGDILYVNQENLVHMDACAGESTIFYQC